TIHIILCLVGGLSMLSCTNSKNKKQKEPNFSATHQTDSEGYLSPKTYKGYKLVWSDEFDENQLDTSVWSYRIGTGSNGWGNNELEYYTDRKENLFLSSGLLTIEARKEKFQGQEYTSARIATQNKKTFTYGRVDIRAKLPVGQGIWPALWMLGNNISSV